MSRLPAGAPILTAAQMRAAEAACFAAGASQAAMMERAAQAVARETSRFASGRPILVLAGPGNNGGDAFAAARLLAECGHDVTVAELDGRWSGAAAAMRERWTGPRCPLGEAPTRPMLVDGLFGIGLSRPIEGEVAEHLRRLNEGAAFTLAIDIASGIEADTGAVLGQAATADATVAFAALKPGHVVGEGARRAGRLIVADIGVPISSLIGTIARPVIAAPDREAHKYTRGMVGVVAGAMPGAARLAAAAALHAGAGYVVLVGDPDPRPPEAIVHRAGDALAQLIEDRRVGALVLGPGLGHDARTVCEQVLASDCPLVLDGDALALVDPETIARRSAATVLTPHSGEFDALFGASEASKIDRTLAAAARCGAIVVHKGAATVIAAPDGLATIAAPSPWLSTAGTGDVLAGTIAARLAAIRDPFVAAEQGVWLHAHAAALAGRALIADGLILHLGEAIEACR